MEGLTQFFFFLFLFFESSASVSVMADPALDILVMLARLDILSQDVWRLSLVSPTDEVKTIKPIIDEPKGGTPTTFITGLGPLSNIVLKNVDEYSKSG